MQNAGPTRFARLPRLPCARARLAHPPPTADKHVLRGMARVAAALHVACNGQGVAKDGTLSIDLTDFKFDEINAEAIPDTDAPPTCTHTPAYPHTSVRT